MYRGVWLTTDEEGTPSGPDRKRRKTEDSEAAAAAAAAGDTPEERQAEALALLRRSRLISEEGIGATWGEPNPDIISASAAIRAWRPIQVQPCCVVHFLTCSSYQASALSVMRSMCSISSASGSAMSNLAKLLPRLPA